MATPILHFTHFDNLAGIVTDQQLSCDRACQARGLTTRDIAYGSLKAKRMGTPVEVSPGGTLGDYVPFYFGPRSPMMFTYHKGNVTGKPENLEDIVYLVSTAETVQQAGLSFVFTDGHPIKEPKAFFNDLADLHEVDLPLMKEKYWFDTDAYPDRKRRRQAEFLVRGAMPWSLIIGIVTKTTATKLQVENLLASQRHIPPCQQRPHWYYD